MRSVTGENPSSTPPKLSLFSLPRQPSEPPGMVTPPLHASISVPFQWEEAPGKPRPFGIIDPNSKPKSARSLDLPPRLFADAKVAHFSLRRPPWTTPFPAETCLLVCRSGFPTLGRRRRRLRGRARMVNMLGLGGG